MNSDLFSMTIRWYRTPNSRVICCFFGESCVELLWLRKMSKLAPLAAQSVGRRGGIRLHTGSATRRSEAVPA
jgi:hypothetical protein